ncbi:MAG TPA: hypothetical protein VL860_13820, partial [Planctomycetota bacterium]|nr:hypothetical protein [Planctomycetota bacterium]
SPLKRRSSEAHPVGRLRTVEESAMKMLTLTLLIVACIVPGCGGPASADDRKDLIVRVGMEFEAADKVLKDFGAKDAAMQIEPSKSSKGAYLKVACYDLDKNPAIIVNYELEGAKNIIRQLNLYYEYKNKGDPANRWLDCKEINLDKLDQ